MTGRLAALIAIALAASCGGSDAPTGSAHVVQVADFIMNPQSGANCGARGGLQPGDPDSIVVQLRMVNTTDDTVFVERVGVHAIVVRASDAADVGRVAYYPDTRAPYTPLPTIVRSHDGNVTMRIMFATAPICLMKPAAYQGFFDLNVSVSVYVTGGQYSTEYKALRVEWRTTG